MLIILGFICTISLNKNDFSMQFFFNYNFF